MQLKIYKGSGAVRFTLVPQRHTVFVEASPAVPGMEKKMPSKGEKKYQWEKKTTLGLKSDELFSIASTCEQLRFNKNVPPLTIIHDPKKGGRQGNNKAIKIVVSQGSILLSIGEFTGKEVTSKITIPLTRAELFALEKALTKAALALLEDSTEEEEGEEGEEEEEFIEDEIQVFR